MVKRFATDLGVWHPVRLNFDFPACEGKGVHGHEKSERGNPFQVVGNVFLKMTLLVKLARFVVEITTSHNTKKLTVSMCCVCVQPVPVSTCVETR